MGNAHRNFLHILVPKPNHLATEPINKEKFPDTILSKIMRKTKQRNSREARLQSHNIELEILDLILVTPLTIGELKHHNWKQHAYNKKHSPREPNTQYRGLVEAQNA